MYVIELHGRQIKAKVYQYERKCLTVLSGTPDMTKSSLKIDEMLTSPRQKRALALTTLYADHQPICTKPHHCFGFSPATSSDPLPSYQTKRKCQRMSDLYSISHRSLPKNTSLHHLSKDLLNHQLTEWTSRAAADKKTRD